MTDLTLLLLTVAVLGVWKFRRDHVGLKPWRICAWCEDILEFGDEGAIETHTICEACTKNWNRAVDRAA